MQIKQLLALLISIVFIAGCENDLTEIQKVITKEEVGTEQAFDVEMLYSDSAQVRVCIKGPLLIRYLDKVDPREEFPEGVKVDFFGPRNTPQSVLTAKYAIRHQKKNEVFIRDSVVWESKNQERLETEELVWDDKNQRVYSNKFVTIRKPEEVIYGYGFEATQDFTHWKIKAIEGRLKVDGLKDEFKN